MKELNELIDRYDVSCHCGAVYVRPKQDGHLVMYSDYASLAQRAEAAEAALEEEKRINSKLREDRAGLARECNDLEAKLAELNKQEPVAYTDAEELESMRKATYADMFAPNDYYKADHQWIPLFTRPAPAISLVQLLPVEMVVEPFSRPVEAQKTLEARAEGFNLCRAAILRNIQEQSQ